MKPPVSLFLFLLMLSPLNYLWFYPFNPLFCRRPLEATTINSTINRNDINTKLEANFPAGLRVVQTAAEGHWITVEF